MRKLCSGLRAFLCLRGSSSMTLPWRPTWSPHITSSAPVLEMCLPYDPHPNTLPEEPSQDKLELSCQSHYAKSL